MKKISLSILLILAMVFNCFSQQQFYDTTFGNNGVITYPNQQGILTKIKKEGNKLYGLTTILGDNVFYTAKRFNIDGSIDQNFSAPILNGNYWNNSSSFQGFISETSTGKIIVGHNSFNMANYWDPWFNVVRLNPDGTIDTSYGENGFVSLVEGTSDSIELLNMELLENDDILLMGYANQQIFTKKFNSEGSLYTNIWNNGKLSYNYNVNEIPVQSVFSQQENCMYLAFSLNNQGLIEGVKIVKINLTTGLLESSFGTNGVLNISDVFCRFALTNTNKLIVTTRSNNSYFNIYKFNTNGTFDETFFNSLSDLIIDSDAYFIRKISSEEDKIVIIYGTTSKILIQGLNENGTPNNSFGNSGQIYREPAGTSAINAFDFKIENNKILVIGEDRLTPQNHTPSLYSFIINQDLSTNLPVTPDKTVIYPNPSSNTVFIKSVTAIQQVEIYNTLGQLVTKTGVTDNKFDVSILATGTYTIKLLTADSVTHIQKLVKNN